MYTRYYSSLLRIGVMFWFFCKRLLCAPLVALRLGQYSLPTGYTMNVLTIENTQLPTHQEPRARFPIFLLYPKTSASRVLQRMGNILVYLQTPFANSSPLHQFLILSLSVWGLVYICVCVSVCEAVLGIRHLRVIPLAFGLHQWVEGRSALHLLHIGLLIPILLMYVRVPIYTYTAVLFLPL